MKTKWLIALLTVSLGMWAQSGTPAPKAASQAAPKTAAKAAPKAAPSAKAAAADQCACCQDGKCDMAGGKCEMPKDGKAAGMMHEGANAGTKPGAMSDHNMSGQKMGAHDMSGHQMSAQCPMMAKDGKMGSAGMKQEGANAGMKKEGADAGTKPGDMSGHNISEHKMGTHCSMMAKDGKKGGCGMCGGAGKTTAK